MCKRSINGEEVNLFRKAILKSNNSKKTQETQARKKTMGDLKKMWSIG